jgi:hypothetical protein
VSERVYSIGRTRRCLLVDDLLVAAEQQIDESESRSAKREGSEAEDEGVLGVVSGQAAVHWQAVALHARTHTHTHR